MHAQHNEWRETEGSIFEAHTLRRFNVIQHPPGQAAGILVAIFAEGAVYQAPWVQNHTLEDGGATMYAPG